MTTYNKESHTTTTYTAEAHTSTTMTDETHTSTTMNDEIPGLPIYCDNTDILCNSLDYDCNGARVMFDDSHTTVTYSQESYS
jgi:hypothetical protein